MAQPVFSGMSLLGALCSLKLTHSENKSTLSSHFQFSLQPASQTPRPFPPPMFQLAISPPIRLRILAGAAFQVLGKDGGLAGFLSVFVQEHLCVGNHWQVISKQDSSVTHS